MTSQPKEIAQQNQTTAPDHQNNGRPEIKITVFSAVHTQESVLENLKQLRERIAKYVREFDQKDLPENLQTEIPKLAVLLQRIERLVLDANRPKKLGGLNSLVCSLEVALSSLFQKKLSKEFTRQIRLDVEREVVRHEHSPITRPIASHFFYVWHAKSVRLSVLYGLTWSFLIIFGSLFSLALTQYAIQNSNADARSTNDTIEKENKRLDTLNIQLERSNTQASKEPARSTADDSGAASEEVKALVQANNRDKIEEKQTNLRESIKETRSKILKFEKQQENIQQNRSPLQKFLSNIDIGFSKTPSQILWVAAAGTLGSIVSILIRVIGESYDRKTYDDRFTPLFIGFFKPVIGASFGVLFLAFLNSGVVSTPLIPEASKTSGADTTIKASDSSETKAAFFLFSVAFVVGFSERLAKDTITKLEGGSRDDQEEPKPSNVRFGVVRFSKPVNRDGRNRKPDESTQAAASVDDESA